MPLPFLAFLNNFFTATSEFRYVERGGMVSAGTGGGIADLSKSNLGTGSGGGSGSGSGGGSKSDQPANIATSQNNSRQQSVIREAVAVPIDSNQTYVYR